MGFRNHWRQNFGGPVEVACDRIAGLGTKKSWFCLGGCSTLMDKLIDHLEGHRAQRDEQILKWTKCRSRCCFS